MNSEQVQSHLERASQAAEVQSNTVSLLKDSLAVYLGLFALSVDARSSPSPDLLSLSASLLLLSNAANGMNPGDERDSVDYLIGMGFEQSGELLARIYGQQLEVTSSPLEDARWYRLTLALLHYLAGGFRVQAFSVVQNLRSMQRSINNEFQEGYRQSYSALRRLYAGRSTSRPVDEWERLLFSDNVREGIQGKRIQSLVHRIQQRRQATLAELGQGNETIWLTNHGIRNNEAPNFWKGYLSRLEDKGISSFTEEQRGGVDGFDVWLRLNRDLLVVLPTGAGKTIIAELKTALTLAINKQVIWILPTRSLVRQTRSVLSSSFRDLGVTVEELPTTEDFQPLFADQLAGGRYIAVTTPEKLAALIRTKPEAVSTIGLVVFDEAQNLFDIHRGATFESVLQSLSAGSPDCSFVFMSAMHDSNQRLRTFLGRLRPNVVLDEIISNNRPTRRINGVLTSSERNKPIIMCYPPGFQAVDGQTDQPFTISFERIRSTRENNPLALSLKILKPLTASKFRTVLFVERKRSTVKQARTIANASRVSIELPRQDVDRLLTELGRESVIAKYGIKSVAPHHGGLSSVEQHLIEKWVRDSRVRTVIATPTLAQGVNLPFDVSIVSFLRRFNTESNNYQDLSQSEILNMLGRAGRAGYVSDGISLIAAERSRETPVNVLDRHRRHYFQIENPSSDFLGLSRLMIRANNSHIDDVNWLYELGSMNFSEAQALVSFSIRATLSDQGVHESLLARLQSFPSIQDLSEYYGEGFDILNILTGTLEPLVANVREQCGEDTALLDALLRTGMPLQVLQRYFHVLREPNDLGNMEIAGRIAWSDQVVMDALTECRDRVWFTQLFENRLSNLGDLFDAITQWRSGAPMNVIEEKWSLRNQKDANEIAIGDFFNHKISLLAQFWGALSVCEEILSAETENRYLENIQLYVREGVDSLSKLMWLKRTGGVDRVLSHTLAIITPEDLDKTVLRVFIDSQLSAWRDDRGSIPHEISNEKLGALISILDE